VLGALPLALATGAGAESRIAIGVVVIGGLLLSSLITLFLTPVLYHLLAGFTQPVNAVQQRLTAQLNDASEASRSAPRLAGAMGTLGEVGEDSRRAVVLQKRHEIDG